MERSVTATNGEEGRRQDGRVVNVASGCVESGDDYGTVVEKVQEIALLFIESYWPSDSLGYLAG